MRLRWAYIIRCTGVIKNDAGEITQINCTYDPATRGANPIDRKVKGTIHWVSAAHALPAEIRLYEELFPQARPDEDENWQANANRASLQVIRDAVVEPSLADAAPFQHYQFERTGYFVVDPDSKPGALVFNRSVGLKDTWGKLEKQAP